MYTVVSEALDIQLRIGKLSHNKVQVGMVKVYNLSRSHNLGYVIQKIRVSVKVN